MASTTGGPAENVKTPPLRDPILVESAVTDLTLVSGVPDDLSLVPATPDDRVFTTRLPVLPEVARTGQTAPVAPVAPVALPSRGRMRRAARSGRLQIAAGLGLVLALAAAGVLVTAHEAQAPDSSAQPVPTLADLRAGMAAAGTWNGTAHYALTQGPQHAGVTVIRHGSLERVDVSTSSGRASLMTTPAGWVACTTTSTSECLVVAPPGAPVPSAFDPGIGSLITTQLPAMAALPRGLTVDRPMPPTGSFPGAACGVLASGTSAGTAGRYCVSHSGLLRRAAFADGDIELTSATPRVDDARFTPPAPAAPMG